MKHTMNTRRTIRMAAVAAAIAAAAGCAKREPTEAELFGYRGEDLADQTNLTYLVLSPTVTNWVPERVLSVFEKYDFTADELALVKASGVLTPGEAYAEFPEGYSRETDEPWFAFWSKEVESFGLKGKTGTLSHYDEDRKVWETSESYFSSYWDTKEDALAALDKVEAAIAQGFNPKKFHKFDGCWVAEYVRLCVMGVVGQKPDGKWSCMLDIRDKCRPGCGVWEPVPEQQERRDRYEYAKAMKAWKAAVAEILAKNREEVSKLASERGLAGLEGAGEPTQGEDGRLVRVAGGMSEPLKSGYVAEEEALAIWKEKVADVEKALGVTIEAEPERQETGGRGVWFSAEGHGELYDARLDVAVPDEPPAEEMPEGEERPAMFGQWRIIGIELLRPGNELPPRPQFKR